MSKEEIKEAEVVKKVTEKEDSSVEVEIEATVVADDNIKDASRDGESIKDDGAKDEKTVKETCAKNGGKTGVVLGTVGCTLGVVACVFAGLAYYNSLQSPIAYFGGSGDGNIATFVEGSMAEVADKVADSVVSITTSSKSQATSFFGQTYEYESSAAGTGVIVTTDGYVLTNKHVIEGATTINVVLSDGTTYEKVTLAAYDPLNDIAFLKIDGVNDLPAATLGDSKTLNVGQQVIAIGNALGQFDNTVTAGIISGTGRSLTATDSSGSYSEQLSDMIQTDAAINSGNSGGPLVNAAGEVIGINTATSSAGENVGFAIPIAAAKGMLKQLVETGKASRAYLGVYSTTITADTAKKYNLPVKSGAYVYSESSYSAIVSGSPADKAGLKSKDIITEVNGVAIGEAGSLSTLIGEYKPGDVVELTVIREGEEMKVSVTLEGYKAA